MVAIALMLAVMAWQLYVLYNQAGFYTEMKKDVPDMSAIKGKAKVLALASWIAFALVLMYVLASVGRMVMKQ